ncbi:MAG TPA: hybrid sensor histidine kinase/response regulator [Bacteroidales bacterium]|nr:hybrid sensor histidine kinase/response regulator [Bacteroidales bacterium]
METLSILVVDDEPGIRSGISRILSPHTVSYPFMEDDFNFTVLEASTGEEAISIIDSRVPDIILLDNKLPGIQGVEVLEYIRDRQYDSMVAMITSYASLEIAVKATGDGAFDFIPKPFTPQELKASIDNISKQLYLRRITRKLKKEGKRIRYQFLSVLSHELKAPLNVVEGYLKMMQNREAGDDLTEYDNMIDRSLNRITMMRGLIMDLLDFTKIRLERKQEKIRKININKLAKMAISTIQPYAIQKNVSITLEGEKDAAMQADPEDMEIILNNLLSNAVKYNKDPGQVILRLTTDHDKLIIEVEDTGIGMDAEEREQLFREFVRIKNEKTKNITGSGLGLSIVRKVMELYRGKIQVESEPDKGSRFILSFPFEAVPGIKDVEKN